ncbi:hypothetical protein Pcinc_040176 [Petrolisthes cinctipes]|uniref:Uncharacterized protein n=1 Tax=Petrolisthes cinctipes TaxID=88211 RepID=A0AAE1BN84_PETCI|nr:hypothetical protein Pcinc_040176 [Petrolisthes cinctipes]
MYETCISDPLEEATVHFIYLWSSPDWQIQSNGQQVPVSVEVYATGKYGHLFTRKVIQRYDFYEFYRDIRPDPDQLKEYYDWNAKVVATDFTPWYLVGQEYRFELETRRIQDFNQGPDGGRDDAEDARGEGY